MKKFYLTFLLISALSIGIMGNNSIAYNHFDMHINENNNEGKTEIAIAENRLVIKNLKQDSVLEVFSIVGTKVYSINVKAGTNEYPLNLPKGYYIIRIGNLAKKIAVR